MAEFTLRFEMDNAAFSECPAEECRDILRAIAARIERNGFPYDSTESWPIRDTNGNRIGLCTIDASDWSAAHGWAE